MSIHQFNDGHGPKQKKQNRGNILHVVKQTVLQKVV